jgi:ATP-dependent exoDNAse (exonuclease V) alpha subunit
MSSSNTDLTCVVSKIIYSSHSFRVILANSSQSTRGGNIKIIDHDQVLDQVRFGDQLTVNLDLIDSSVTPQTSAKYQNDSVPSYKLIELTAFKRPFNAEQLKFLLRELKVKSPNMIDNFFINLDYREMGDALRDKDEFEIEEQVSITSRKSGLDEKTEKKITNLFKEISDEVDYFQSIKVTNFLLQFCRSSFDQTKWKTCRKMIKKLIKTHPPQKIIEFLKTDPYQLISNHHLKTNLTKFEILDQIAKDLGEHRLPLSPPDSVGGIPPISPPDSVGGIPPISPPDSVGGIPPISPHERKIGDIPPISPHERKIGGIPPISPHDGVGGIPPISPHDGGGIPPISKSQSSAGGDLKHNQLNSNQTSIDVKQQLSTSQQLLGGPNVMKFDLKNQSRQYAGIWTALMTTLKSNGNCYLDRSTLLKRSEKILDQVVPNIDRHYQSLTHYQVTGTNRVPVSIVYPKIYDTSEKFIANWMANYKYLSKNEDYRQIAEIIHQKFHKTVQSTDSVSNHHQQILASQLTSTILDQTQTKAVNGLIEHGLGIITGPPGVGKTRVIGALAEILTMLRQQLIFAAPTGMACKNLAKNLPPGSLVFTIAKLLFSNNNEPCLLDILTRNTNGLVIDETSMVDMNDFYQILKRLPTKNYRLVLVGDPNQLPSLGPGKILNDLITSGHFPVYQLEVNYRQKESNGQILSNAMKILAGIPKLEDGIDFQQIWTPGDEETIASCLEVLDKLKTEHRLDDLIILSPFSQAGVLASKLINPRFKKFFNPNPPTTHSSYSVGDKVMQLKNNLKKGLVNGDIGVITEINLKTPHQIDHISVEFENIYTNPIKTPSHQTDFDEYQLSSSQVLPINRAILVDSHLPTRIVKYTPCEIREELTLAYVISIHKSQGNGYRTVILLTPRYYNPNFLNRNMLYTAITRAKEMVYIIGGDLTNCIKTKQHVRNSRLSVRLKQMYKQREQELHETLANL